MWISNPFQAQQSLSQGNIHLHILHVCVLHKQIIAVPFANTIVKDKCLLEQNQILPLHTTTSQQICFQKCLGKSVQPENPSQLKSTIILWRYLAVRKESRHTLSSLYISSEAVILQVPVHTYLPSHVESLLQRPCTIAMRKVSSAMSKSMNRCSQT